MSRHALSPTACWLFGLRPKVHNWCITTAYEVHNLVKCEGNVKTASLLSAKTVRPHTSALVTIGGLNALSRRVPERPTRMWAHEGPSWGWTNGPGTQGPDMNRSPRGRYGAPYNPNADTGTRLRSPRGSCIRKQFRISKKTIRF